MNVFEIKGHLGSGHFGSVHKGEITHCLGYNSKISVAVKSLKGLAGEQQIQNFLYEIKIMSYVNPHMNVLNMVGCCTRNLEEQGDLWLLIESATVLSLRIPLHDE